MRVIVVALFVLCAAGRADAYPQWQLSRDATCSSCHIAPDGGGLLTEGGLEVANTVAFRDADPGFLYGALSTPSWLVLGGDVRIATGLVQARHTGFAFFPMQAELSGTALHPSGFSVHATAGFRRPQTDGSALHALWSREHYVMWQQKPGEGTGLFVRAGRLMPTFGLRLAEHVVYTQRYGGRPLYYEAYAAALGYIDQRFEVHVTAFAHDRIASTAEHGDGAALYAEARIGTHAAVGLSGKYSASDDQTRTFAGVTGKLYLEDSDIMLLGEAQLIRQHIDVGDLVTNQLAIYALASRPLGSGLQLDVGLGHYAQDLSANLPRDCLDVNLHWFQSSHIEWLLTTRLEHLGGGPTAGYALAQLHYRL